MAYRRRPTLFIATIAMLLTVVSPSVATGSTLNDLDLQPITDLPATPAGSRLVDLEVGDDGFIALVRTPERWVLWRSGDGVEWTRQRLPNWRFGETRMLAVTTVDSTTYLGGASVTSKPRAWSRNGDGPWSRLPLPLSGGSGGTGFVGDMEVCGDRVLMWGSDSASNHYESAVWGFAANGEIEAHHFPSSMPGGPNFEIFCRGRQFAAFVADGQPPGAEVDVENDVWVSATGARWRLKTEDVVEPPLFLSALDRAGDRWVAASHGEAMAVSRNGIGWQLLDTLPTELQGSGRSFDLAGGDLGLVVLATEWGFEPELTLWWTPDVRTWQRIDAVPGLAVGGVSAAVSPNAVVVAPNAGFESGAPVLYVATA